MTLSKEIEVKTSILVEGLKADPAACQGVGQEYTENINWLFAYDMDVAKKEMGGVILPSDLILPLGTTVQVRYNPNSPWLLTEEDGAKVLKKAGKTIISVDLPKRPAFYDKQTSDGVAMNKVGVIRGTDALCFCVSNYCFNWEQGLQCRYCNMNAAWLTTGKQVVLNKTVDQMVEVATAAYNEGYDFHIVVSAGTHRLGHSMHPMIAEVISRVREATYGDGLPGAINIAPPDNLDDIRLIHQTGMKWIGHNIEIFDPDFFRAICPGKAKYWGQEHFWEANKKAVELFGRGRVFSAIVAGIEPRDCHMEGVKKALDIGFIPVSLPWTPMALSKYEGHRAPEPSWYLDLLYEEYELIKERLPESICKADLDRWKSGDEIAIYDIWEKGFQCNGCLSIALCYDLIREDYDIPKEAIKRYDLVREISISEVSAEVINIGKGGFR